MRMAENRLSKESLLTVSDNIKRTVFHVEEAAVRYGKDPREIQIVGAIKKMPAEYAFLCKENGIDTVGENRVEELVSKYEIYKQLQLHFIGHLQRNKAKLAVGKISMLQSLDSLKLAEELNTLSGQIGKTLDVLVQVNISREESKSGIIPEQLEDFLFEASQYPFLSVKGLMCIPEKGNSRVFFEKMYQLFIDIRTKKVDNIDMAVLSMGMSSDFEDAIASGSNMLRLGTALFGERSF